MNEDRITEMTHRLLRLTAKEYPDISVPEMMSVVFTIAKSLIHVALEHNNDAHNRDEIIRCVGSLAQVVQDFTPKEKLN